MCSDQLTRFGPDIWIRREPLRFFGLEIGRTMTVIRLTSGELFIHSPAQLTTELTTALSELGDVRYVVPASKLHGHLYMEQYRDAFPEVELFAAPGLSTRRTDLTFDGLLGSVPDSRWATDIDQVAVMGNWWLTEIAFFHRPSRTLILGDVGFHIGPDSPLVARLLARIVGMYRTVGPSPDYRLTVKNRETVKRSIRSVLAWDFDIIIPGHGEIVESDSASALRDGFEWVL